MNNDLVSIIVPVYNVEKYLKECVDSILAQTYHNLEIILIDDGATDSSGIMCDEFASIDTRVNVIHKKNGGLSDARNAGLETAHGRYILFCDSDDSLKENAVELLHNRLADDSDADFVFYNAEAFAEEGLTCNPNSYLRKKKYPDAPGYVQAYKQLLRDEYIPCAYLYLFRGSFLKKHGLKFEKGILGEDELFSYFAYLNAGKAIYLEDALYNRRIRPGSIMTSSTNREKKFASYFQIVQTMLSAPERQNSVQTSNEFLDRMAKSAVYAYRKLGGIQKAANAEKYQKLVCIIYCNKGFGDMSLIARIKWFHLGVFLSGVRKNVRRIKGR